MTSHISAAGQAAAGRAAAGQAATDQDLVSASAAAVVDGAAARSAARC